MHGLFIFIFFIGIGHNAASNLEVYRFILCNEGAYSDIQVCITIKSDITDNACVNTPLRWFEFVNDLHGADLLAPP